MRFRGGSSLLPRKKINGREREEGRKKIFSDWGTEVRVASDWVLQMRGWKRLVGV